MDVQHALTQRSQLRHEVKRATALKHELGDQLAEVDQKRKQMPRRRQAALDAEARGGEPADLDALEREGAQLEREREQLVERKQAAGAVVSEAAQQIVELHHRRFDLFAENAEQLTQEAARKLAGLRDGTVSYPDAHHAIEVARKEWNLLAHDYNLGEKAKGTGYLAQKEARSRFLEPCAPNPLPAPGKIFGAPPPRPPQIEVDDAA